MLEMKINVCSSQKVSLINCKINSNLWCIERSLLSEASIDSKYSKWQKKDHAFSSNHWCNSEFSNCLDLCNTKNRK